MDTLKCCLCGQMIEGHAEGLVRHLRTHFDKNEFVRELTVFACPVRGCKTQYQRLSALKQHIITKHPLNQVTSEHQQRNDESYETNTQPEEEHISLDDEHFDKEPGEPSLLEDLIKFASFSMCKLKSDLSFTDVKIKRVIGVCESLVDQINSYVAENIQRFIGDMDIVVDAEMILKLQKAVTVPKLFEQISTTRRQKNFLEKQIGNIPNPVPIMLRERREIRVVKGQRTVKKVRLRVFRTF